ncbi:unnamed protein product [Dimorphilus gyrociliatus]|uniref:Threonylcarbamoyl-AMP synthase n=1 Tax=Dimorphilus gyrociliatus TaxID=2664684 RepID=A0A7I8VQ82_9ANNE|nr:unnamed protein product [Dimorphilus gyrociliatus]
MVMLVRSLSDIIIKPGIKQILRQERTIISESVKTRADSMMSLTAKDKLFKLNESSEDKLVELACEDLENNKVVSLPTDTIYGIAALVNSDEAINKLYDIKHRNRVKPIAISCGNIDNVYYYSNVTISESLLSKLLPGPVTVIFERKSTLNRNLNPDTNLVGIRIPNHPFVRKICMKLNCAIALTSANLSDKPSALKIEEFREIWPDLSKIFDGGVIGNTIESRLGSTIVDLSKIGYFQIVREGSAYKETVQILEENGLRNMQN